MTLPDDLRKRARKLAINLLQQLDDLYHLRPKETFDELAPIKFVEEYLIKSFASALLLADSEGYRRGVEYAAKLIDSPEFYVKPREHRVGVILALLKKEDGK